MCVKGASYLAPKLLVSRENAHQWRSTFYCAGSLTNFLLLSTPQRQLICCYISFENERVRNVALKPRLDGFFVWKEKSIAQSQPFQVEIHPYLDSGEAGEVWDDLEYKD